MKAPMPSILSPLRHAWRACAAWLANLFTPAEPEPQDYPFAPADLARLLRVTGADRSAELDELTWRDLLLQRYLDQLGAGVSIFGRQELYRRLRGGAGMAEASTQRARVARLLDAPGQMENLQRKLNCLRHADVEVTGLLFEDEPPHRPWWVGHLLWLPVLLVASIVAALLSGPWGWVGAGIAMYALIGVRMRYQDSIGAWTRSVRALQMVLRTCSLLDGSGLVRAEAFAGRGAVAGRLNRALQRSPMAEAMPSSAEYANWFLAAEVRHYFHTAALVFSQRTFLRECNRLCAALEADVALARHLRARTMTGATWCWSELGDERTLRLEGGEHPLLEDASALSIETVGKGIFLSGQNGVGKSTFLRTVGLNLAVARAFGFCYARRADLPAIPVLASMRNEDSMLEGQSLYIEELARARELLAASAARPVVCLIDEVFRGTNHEEAVSAAAAVVDALARQALVMVSSHNLVLGSLLAHRLAPWRIERHTDGVLRLASGVLGRTNGVALLAEHGFDSGIQRQAGRVAAWLAGQRGAGEGAGLLAHDATVIETRPQVS
jgi:hypothetical protein